MKSKQLIPLTSLRFFAAFAVVLQHMHFLSGAGSTVAVEFFFVLSGFILAYGYNDRITMIDMRQFCRFWVMRIARLYPVYLLTGLLAACLWIGSPWPYSVREILCSLFAVQTFFPIGDSVYIFNGPSWSVSDEFFFYLALPFILVGFRACGLHRSKIKSITALVALLAIRVIVAIPYLNDTQVYSFGWWLLYISPYVRILGFAQGVVLGLIFLLVDQKKSHSSRTLLWTVLELCAVVSLVFAAKITAPWPTALQASFAFAIPISFVILVFALGKGYISSAISVRPLVHLGEVSFSTYMIHAIVFDWTDRFMTRDFYGYSSHSWHIMGQVGLVIIVLSLSDIIYRYVETPARKFAKEWSYRRLGSGSPLSVRE